MTCRHCEHYDLNAVKDRAGRVRKNRVARCLWKSSEVWPLSVTLRRYNNRPDAGHMEPDDGEGCPCFAPASAGKTLGEG